MRINEQIRTTLSEYNIPENDGLAYLLSIYFNCRPSYTPPLLVQKMNITNILGIGKNREIIWHIPLFENENIATTWEWVEEWNNRFEAINPIRKCVLRTVLIRMKAFFAENPDVRKEEVIEGTKMYFQSVRDRQYLISPHYFISKGVGKDRYSALLTWVVKYRETMKNLAENNPDEEADLRSTIQ